jgi:hypothetical protein
MATKFSTCAGRNPARMLNSAKWTPARIGAPAQTADRAPARRDSAGLAPTAAAALGCLCSGGGGGRTAVAGGGRAPRDRAAIGEDHAGPRACAHLSDTESDPRDGGRGGGGQRQNDCNSQRRHLHLVASFLDPEQGFPVSERLGGARACESGGGGQRLELVQHGRPRLGRSARGPGALDGKAGLHLVDEGGALSAPHPTLFVFVGNRYGLQSTESRNACVRLSMPGAAQLPRRVRAARFARGAWR